MPTENSPSTDKEGTTTDAPTREQIDLLFATLIDGADQEVSGLKAEAMVQMLATVWRSARELEEAGDYAPDTGSVEEVAEEWL